MATQLKTAQATANSLLPTSNGSTSGGLQNLYGPVSSRAGVTGRGGGGSCSGGSASCSGNHNNSNNNNLEDLHGQVIRLKRHRDRLMQSHQDISKELADTKVGGCGGWMNGWVGGLGRRSAGNSLLWGEGVCMHMSKAMHAQLGVLRHPNRVCAGCVCVCTLCEPQRGTARAAIVPSAAV